jgi:hypothetical protein
LREVIFDLSESPSQNSQLRSIANLPDRPFLERILNEIGFQDIKMSIETKKEYYVDLLELLNWLKMIGANRYWSKSLYEGLSARNFLDTIANKYKQRFQEKGKIFATFEVIFVELVK